MPKLVWAGIVENAYHDENGKFVPVGQWDIRRFRTLPQTIDIHLCVLVDTELTEKERTLIIEVALANPHGDSELQDANILECTVPARSEEHNMKRNMLFSHCLQHVIRFAGMYRFDILINGEWAGQSRFIVEVIGSPS